MADEKIKKVSELFTDRLQKANDEYIKLQREIAARSELTDEESRRAEEIETRLSELSDEVGRRAIASYEESGRLAEIETKVVELEEAVELSAFGEAKRRNELTVLFREKNDILSEIASRGVFTSDEEREVIDLETELEFLQTGAAKREKPTDTEFARLEFLRGQVLDLERLGKRMNDISKEARDEFGLISPEDLESIAAIPDVHERTERLAEITEKTMVEFAKLHGIPIS